MQPLPPDWQDFFAELGEGSATIGLFELPGRGTQPVLLIYASPDMQVPQEVMLRSTPELYKPDGVYVARMLIEIQAEEFPPPRNYEELNVSLHFQPWRETRQITVIFKPTPLRFETFLNPMGREDRAILQQLEQLPMLNVSIAQSGQALWGKQFPWRESCRAIVRQILEETRGFSPIDAQAWQQAKEQVMERSVF